MREDPTLKTDEAVFAWLIRPEYAGQLPLTIVAFGRYLRYARTFLDGCGKREEGWKRPRTATA